MSKFFAVPFAFSGDRVAYPNEVQGDGSASYTQGFGYDYERPGDGSDPLYKPVPRDGMNGLFYDITAALGEIQKYGLPLWQEAGRPYPLSAQVYHNNKGWRSKISNNNTTPVEGTDWTEISSVPAGSTTVVGAVRLATSNEAAQGILDTVAVTPSGLKPLLDAKAPLSNPYFSGTVRVPSPARSDSTERAANTWWVKDWFYNDVNPYLQANLGFTPVRQGGGVSQLANTVFLGYDGSALRYTIDATDFGQFWADNNGVNKCLGAGFLRNAEAIAAGFLKASNFGGAGISGGIEFQIPTDIGAVRVKLFHIGTVGNDTATTITFPGGGFPSECHGVVPVATSNQGLSSSDDNRFAHGAGNYTKDNFVLYNDGAAGTFLILAFGR